MEIRTRNSNFSQFSKDLWLIAEHNETRIDFEVDEKELKQFALMLLDVADDCMRKVDLHDASSAIQNSMDVVRDATKHIEVE